MQRRAAHVVHTICMHVRERARTHNAYGRSASDIHHGEPKSRGMEIGRQRRRYYQIIYLHYGIHRRPIIHP